jgi:hypothetical protein
MWLWLAALVGLRDRPLDRGIGAPSARCLPHAAQLLLKAVGRPNPVVLSQGGAQDTQGRQPV